MLWMMVEAETREAACGRRRLSALRRASIFLEAYVLLVLIDLGLHTIGLDRVCSLISRKPKSSIKASTLAEVAEVAWVALGAYRWYRPGVACLHRAVTLYALFKHRSIPIELCLGIKAHPFAAHSWVEYKGEIVGDSPGLRDTFHTLKRIT
jgi:transglutaminase superfamily protein